MATTEWELTNDHAAGKIPASSWGNAVSNNLETTRWGALAYTWASDANQTLTTTQDANPVLILSGGGLTATRELVLRTTGGGGFWLVINETSGSQAVTVKTSGGSGVTIGNGKAAIVYCDGTNIDHAQTDPRAFSLTATATWDPASIADGAVASTTITVTGASVGDPVVASLSTLSTNDVLISAHVQAADTVRVVVMNKTGGALDLASGTLRVAVLRY